MPALGANASSDATTTLSIPSDVTPGAYYFLAVVDALGTVAEQDETNNLGVAPLTVVSSLVKTFALAGDLLQTGCTSPLRNGRLAIQGTLAVSSQTATSLTATLTLTAPLAAGWKLSGPVKATVDPTGAIGGTFTFTTTQGSVLETGAGVIANGQVNGPATVLTLTLTGTPASGESCQVLATLAAPVVPVTFLTVQHDTEAGSLQPVDGVFTAAPSFPVSLSRFRALVDVAVDTGFPAPGTVVITGPSGPGTPAVELQPARSNRRRVSRTVEFRPRPVRRLGRAIQGHRLGLHSFGPRSRCPPGGPGPDVHGDDGRTVAGWLGLA